MDSNSFFIEYFYQNEPVIAEIKICCNQQDVWYYDVLMANEYQFTMTPSINDESGINWIVSLKNADKKIDQALVDIIGHEIEKQMFEPQ